MDLHTSVIDIKGVGPKTEKLYSKLGLNEAEDFLYYFPRDYMDYTEPVIPTEERIGDTIFFKATVAKQPLLRRAGRLQIVTSVLVSEGVQISSVWFHMPYLTKSLKMGSTYVFRGRLEKKGARLAVEQPLIFACDEYEKIVHTLQPIYHLTKGLSNKALIKTVKEVLSNVEIPDMCLSDQKGELIRSEAIRKIHFPTDRNELVHARKRLVYDEFFLFMLKLRLLKEEQKDARNHFKIYPSARTARIIEKLPYTLTNSQKKVWAEVEDNLMSNHSMNRLIQGDVGSGKTIIAILAAIMVAESGYQTALMAPTEILATQHFEGICKIMTQHGMEISAVLLTGSMTASQKREVYRKIESGEAKIVVGTHALFQEKVIYQNLALVITDEQHRFGVKQRERLQDKNENQPHVLVMSATPIPRTLAIIMYGDLDISVIDEVPARRLPIKSSVVNTDYRETVYKYILSAVKSGRQAYVICPLVEESEGLDAENVVDYTERLREYFSGETGIEIAYLHGKMKPAEKNRVMEHFYKNDIQILVSTTVVEVGVNVPNATMMLIENAERFGLAQLHQLRGRIGRGEYQSYCIFMSSNRSDRTMKRLETLKKSNDGFFIASEDLKQRGPGELFGVAQSGELNFALGDIYTDADVLKEASDAVNELLKEDPLLENHPRIKEYLRNNDRFFNTTL